MPDPESHMDLEVKDQLYVPRPVSSRPTSIGTGLQTKVNLKVNVDERQRTMEGFRTLALIATFLASVQAQLIAITAGSFSELSSKFILAFWIAGLFCDVFGAVLATLTARWLEVLQPPDVEFLNNTWAANKKDLRPPTHEQSRRHRKGLIEYCVAMALFSSPGTVAVGVILFIVGLMVYIWSQQPLLVSIIATLPCAILTPLIACLFIPHQAAGGRRNVIELLARQKGNW